MNTNYEKDFVPYEQALALKELGFNEESFGKFYTKPKSKMFGIDEKGRHYPIKNTYKKLYTLGESFVLNDDNVISAPLYQQVFRWFREKYNIDAWVQPFVSEKHGKPFLPDESYAYYIFEDGVYVADGVNFLDSEEAELACLKKLIEITKNK